MTTQRDRIPESADLYAAVLEALPVGVCGRDKERRILYLNPRAEQLTGCRSDAVRGKPCYLVLRHCDADGADLCQRACLALGNLADCSPPLPFEVFLHTAAGGRILVTTQIAPLRSASGEVVGYVEVFHDAREPRERARPADLPLVQRRGGRTGARESTAPLVLLVDDEQNARAFIVASLRANSYRVLIAGDAAQALALATKERPDVVLLDLGTCGRGALETIERLHSASPAPIVVLSARGTEREKVASLDRGADDFLTKPLSMGELFARLRAVLRRARVNPELTGVDVISAGDLCIDFGKRSVLRGGRPVKLTRTEYELLACLARSPEKAVGHAELLHRVWGPGCEGQNEYLHTFIAQLRRKLEANPSRPRHIITEPRYGYRFCLNP